MGIDTFKDYVGLFGDQDKFSPGTRAVMTERQIKRGLERGTVRLTEIGNAKATVTYLLTGKWFFISGGNYNTRSIMMGACCGDVAGSVYEWHNIKYKPDPMHLVRRDARFTDDTVLTCAVAKGLQDGLSRLPKEWMEDPQAEELLMSSVQEALLTYGRRYPYAGYGGRFRRWLKEEDPKPYNSWGNGSAMRASYAGWVSKNLKEAEKLAAISAKVTHSHPEGIMGAAVTAGCINILRAGGTKEDVREYASLFYNLNFSLDEIRESYHFDVSCAGSVPQAIRAFLEGNDFADVISLAISIGGDSDTIAAIAGSIAEVIYPIPQGFRSRVIDRMDRFLLNTIVESVDFAYDRLCS